MCCGTKICTLCTCVILVAIVIGFLFGFGVFKDGFHKLKNTIHDCDPASNGTLCSSSRPFLGFPTPPPPPPY